MIPYFISQTYVVFGVTFQTWGTLVALGYALGTFLAYRRAKTKGLDGNRILDAAFWIFLSAFAGARLFHVLFYDPTYYLAHPWDALDPRKPGFAIFGGFAGAALAFFFYVRRHALDFLAYADTLVWGLPWGCGVGRIGCFLIHDHPGTLTNFVLGVRYPDGQTRHDLGLYLSLIGFATGGLFLWRNRDRRAPGFWLAAYMVIEGAARFFLDFLRVADVRYVGLTPTQFFAIPLFAGGIFFLRRMKSHHV